MRNLASIQEIVNISPIEKADSIVKATILGWEVVVKKDEFKVGDKCLYIEIDSIVPKEDPRFSFLESRKYRVHTIKLRGQISQGLCLPIKDFPELKDYKIGEDVSEVLKIKKYDPEAQIERNSVSSKKPDSRLVKFFMKFSWFRKLRRLLEDNTRGFPSDIISKSDEERIQTMPALLKKHAGETVSYTEKLDGQSYTAVLRKKKLYFPFFPRYEFIIASRNLKVPVDGNSNYADITRRYFVQEKLKSLLKRMDDVKAVAIQGEICGPGIQQNKYKFKENHLFLFKVKYIMNDGTEKILSQDSVDIFAGNTGFEAVPYLGTFKLPDNVEALVKLAGSEKSRKADVQREGIVIRQDKWNYEYSFKVINPEFLLKYNE